jgi:hypothetical protein
LTKADLDRLESTGFLDPNRRGDRADEGEAVVCAMRHALESIP